MNELVTTNGVNFTEEQIALLKRTICAGATDDEFSLFTAQCKRTKLDPFAKQIHAVKRWDKKAGREIMSIQTGIDGYRLIAERTEKYEGQTDPMWCGADGIWKDVWLSNHPPSAAKVGVHKAGFKQPIIAVALWTEYVQQYFKDGKTILSPMWAKMGALMISKCAEALALRKAFPQELSGIYTNEEMAQADGDSAPNPAPILTYSAAPPPPPLPLDPVDDRPLADLLGDEQALAHAFLVDIGWLKADQGFFDLKPAQDARIRANVSGFLASAAERAQKAPAPIPGSLVEAATKAVQDVLGGGKNAR